MANLNFFMMEPPIMALRIHNNTRKVLEEFNPVDSSQHSTFPGVDYAEPRQGGPRCEPGASDGRMSRALLRLYVGRR